MPENALRKEMESAARAITETKEEVRVALLEAKGQGKASKAHASCAMRLATKSGNARRPRE